MLCPLSHCPLPFAKYTYLRVLPSTVTHIGTYTFNSLFQGGTVPWILDALRRSVLYWKAQIKMRKLFLERRSGAQLPYRIVSQYTVSQYEQWTCDATWTKTIVQRGRVSPCYDRSHILSSPIAKSWAFTSICGFYIGTVKGSPASLQTVWCSLFTHAERMET